MRFSAGIDLGGTFTKIALVDFEGNVIQHKKVLSLIGSSPMELLNQVRLSLKHMCSRAHLPYPPGTTIQHSAFGESAGVIGAATLATLRGHE